MGAEPGLSQEHQVDCVVNNEVGDFTSFFYYVDGGGMKQCRATHSPETGTSRSQEGTRIRFARWTVTEWVAEGRATNKRLDKVSPAYACGRIQSP